jgi:hypothetical protein
MSMYKIELMNKNINDLWNNIDLVENKILVPYQKEIKQLPPDQQKNEWHKYFLLQKLIENCIDTINNLVEEMNTMHTKEEFKHNNNTIIHLKHYIKILGGDPGLINYTKNNDLI